LGNKPILSIENLNAFYGDSHILYDVSFALKKDTVLALLGRNGAGKTTCINSIIGFLPERSGLIELDGTPLQPLSPEKICHAGIGIVPQGRRIFPSLTVKENLEVAYQAPRAGSSRQWNLKDVFQFFPRLQERQDQVAGSLSGGEQQMLAVARGLMSKPKLLLLDEPSLGLAPLIVQQLFATIRKIRERGMTILLVEQNANMALSVADRGYVLVTGNLTVEGTPKELLNNDEVRSAYLGGGKK
jgi:branched-chain amino acid transport system ATP-binding protein